MEKKMKTKFIFMIKETHVMVTKIDTRVHNVRTSFSFFYVKLHFQFFILYLAEMVEQIGRKSQLYPISRGVNILSVPIALGLREKYRCSHPMVEFSSFMFATSSLFLRNFHWEVTQFTGTKTEE